MNWFQKENSVIFYYKFKNKQLGNVTEKNKTNKYGWICSDIIVNNIHQRMCKVENNFFFKQKKKHGYEQSVKIKTEHSL